MINLTRLNGTPFLLNCDILKFAEAAPDTTLTLLNGEKLIVQESLDELSDRVRTYRSDLMRLAQGEAPQA